MSIAYLDWPTGTEPEPHPAPRGMAAHLPARLAADAPRHRWSSLALSIAGHAVVIYAAFFLAFVVPKKLNEQAITVSIAPTQAAKTDPLPMPRLEHPPAPLQPAMPQVDIAPQPSPITIQAAPPVAASPVQAVKPAPDAPASPPRFDADYLNNPAPVYPNMSRRLREVGTVQLRVRVSAEGAPLDIQLLKSSGYARLDESAKAAVQKWKFVPAKRSGAAVEDWVVVPVEFSLPHSQPAP